MVEDCVIGSNTERHLAALDAMEYLQHGARRKVAEVLDAFATLGTPSPRLVEVAP